MVLILLSVASIVVVVSDVMGLNERVWVDVTKLVADVFLVLVVRTKMELVEVEVGTFDLPTVLVLRISVLNLRVSVTVPKLEATSATNWVIMVVMVLEIGMVTC